MKNQCMGCQASWPRHRSKHGGHLVHKVEGGYPHEIVSCTAHLYLDLDKPQGRPIVVAPSPQWRPSDPE